MESLSGERRSPDTMAPAIIGIIGGSALGDAFELEEEQARFLVTPHGAPSDPPRVGMHAGVQVAFLPRHGKDHRIPPRSEEHTSELQSQSNLVCRLLLEKKKKIKRNEHLAPVKRGARPH